MNAYRGRELERITSGRHHNKIEIMKRHIERKLNRDLQRRELRRVQYS